MSQSEEELLLKLIFPDHNKLAANYIGKSASYLAQKQVLMSLRQRQSWCQNNLI